MVSKNSHPNKEMADLILRRIMLNQELGQARQARGIACGELCDTAAELLAAARRETDEAESEKFIAIHRILLEGHDEYLKLIRQETNRITAIMLRMREGLRALEG